MAKAMEHTRKRLNRSQLPGEGVELASNGGSAVKFERDNSQGDFDAKSNNSMEMYGNGIPSNLPGLKSNAGPGRMKKTS